ncbi:hypothetical protein MKW94_011645 [Papaver nudicaule]|uniref:Uncharacterized protein ycf68 n=1 Tax=Papaver nudicaule TaxID=74823 RepID=A0AA41SLQ6_PAPNU|nr:hypothetical protein [Papaver nudicaule]
MWIIQGTLAWRTPSEDRWGDSGEIQCRSNFLFTLYGQLSLEHRFRFGLNGKMEHLTTHLHRPRTTRSPQNERGDGGIVPFEPFFHAFPGRFEKGS